MKDSGDVLVSGQSIRYVFVNLKTTAAPLAALTDLSGSLPILTNLALPISCLVYYRFVVETNLAAFDSKYSRSVFERTP